jgi:hypothetical protein
MSQLPTATARTFINAILQTLRTHFSAVELTISAGDLIDDATGDYAEPFTSPWLRVYVIPASMDISVRKRPGRVPTVYACQIQCCLSTKTENFQIELSEFSSNVLTLVSGWEAPGERVRDGRLQIGQRWGLGEAVEPPALISVFPGALNSLPHGHDALIVSWEQTVHRPERLTANDPLPDY